MTKKQRRKLNEIDRRLGLPKGASVATIREIVKYARTKTDTEKTK